MVFFYYKTLSFTLSVYHQWAESTKAIDIIYLFYMIYKYPQIEIHQLIFFKHKLK